MVPRVQIKSVLGGKPSHPRQEEGLTRCLRAKLFAGDLRTAKFAVAPFAGFWD